MKHGKTICIYNLKGGVGKTTITFNLAAALAARNQHILLVDMDSQASLSALCKVKMFSLKHTIYQVLLQEIPLQDILLQTTHDGIMLLPADLNLAAAERILLNKASWGTILQRLLASHKLQYDYILIDCPGSFGILAQNAILASDVILCPMTCEDMTLRVYSLVYEDISILARDFNQDFPIYVIRNKLDRRKLHDKTMSEEIEKQIPLTLKTIIPDRTAVSNATSWDMTILEYEKNSEAASAFRRLAHELMEVLA